MKDYRILKMLAVLSISGCFDNSPLVVEAESQISKEEAMKVALFDANLTCDADSMVYVTRSLESVSYKTLTADCVTEKTTFYKVSVIYTCLKTGTEK
jgi:hypothetical protein